MLNGINIASDMQVIPIVLNLRSKKWLLLQIYRFPDQNPAYFRENSQRVIDFSLPTYENVLTIADFDMDENEADILSMMEDNGMTNSKNSLFCNNTFETGFSDFHHMMYTTLKTTFKRLPPFVVMEISLKFLFENS